MAAIKRIVYGSTTRYFLGDKEVSQAEFDATTDKARFDEMLEARRGPGLLGTDNQFFTGRWSEDAPHPLYRQIAEQQGVSTTGKVYQGQLARFPGDPRAWVSGIGDVKRICESEGWGVEGAGVNVPVSNKSNDVPDDDPHEYTPAPDLVQNEIDRRLSENPDAVPADFPAEAVAESMKPSWAK
jgi:hypothetical protein